MIFNLEIDVMADAVAYAGTKGLRMGSTAKAGGCEMAERILVPPRETVCCHISFACSSDHRV